MPMGEGQASTDLLHQVRCCLDGQRSVLLEPVCQRAVAEPSHHQIRTVVVLPEVDQRNDVGMLEAGHQAGLSTEAPQELVVCGEFGPDHLHGDLAADRGLDASPHDAVSALRDALDELEPAHYLTQGGPLPSAHSGAVVAPDDASLPRWAAHRPAAPRADTVRSPARAVGPGCRWRRRAPPDPVRHAQGPRLGTIARFVSGERNAAPPSWRNTGTATRGLSGVVGRVAPYGRILTPSSSSEE